MSNVGSNDLRIALTVIALWNDATPNEAPGVAVTTALRLIADADRAKLADTLRQAPEGVTPAALIGLARLSRILIDAAR